MRIRRVAQLALLVLEATSHSSSSLSYTHPTLTEVRVAASGTHTLQEEIVEVKLKCWSALATSSFLPSTPLVCPSRRPLPPMDTSCKRQPRLDTSWTYSCRRHPQAMGCPQGPATMIF
jgi:hypothetical protein